jgi:hypothetical protein
MTEQSRRAVLMKVQWRSNKHSQVEKSGIKHDMKTFSLSKENFTFSDTEMNERNLMKRTYIKKLMLSMKKSKIKQDIEI